jgi:hypothetical protein
VPRSHKSFFPDISRTDSEARTSTQIPEFSKNEFWLAFADRML